MSHMNAAWSNEPPWAEAVPAIFKEPMTIAFGGAILAHAIFFLGLPVVAGTEKQPDVQPVGTTVLTPEEKALIPPDLAQTTLSTGSFLPNNGLIVPPLPSGGTTPGTTTISGTNYGFGQPNEPSFSTGGYSTGSNSSSSSDINARLEEAKKQQEEARKELIRKTEIAQKEAEKKIDKESAEKPPVPLPSVGAMPPGTPTGEAANPAATPTAQQPQTPAQPPRPSNADIIAQAPGIYAFNPKLTGPTIGDKIAVGTAISTWGSKPDSKEQEILKSSGQNFPSPFLVDTKTQTLPYPIGINKQPVAVISEYAQKVKENYGTAIVGIAINSQGKLASEPSIIQSSGYKVLDEYAIEYVNSRIFPVTGRGKLYYMVIPIDPPINKPTA